MKLPRLSAPTLLLLPAIIVLAAVVVVPLLLSFYSSFTPFRLTKPETFFVFIGLRNYVKSSPTGISGSPSAAPCCC